MTRGPAVWVIAVMGVVGFAIITFFMLFMLKKFQESPAGVRAKLSIDIRKQFGLQAVQASVRRGVEERPYLRIEYRTTKRLSPDLEAMDKEMEQIALYSIEEYAGEVEQKDLVTIAVTRHELHGDGCSQQVHTNELDVPNPHKEDENPYDFED